METSSELHPSVFPSVLAITVGAVTVEDVVVIRETVMGLLERSWIVPRLCSFSLLIKDGFSPESEPISWYQGRVDIKSQVVVVVMVTVVVEGVGTSVLRRGTRGSRNSQTLGLSTSTKFLLSSRGLHFCKGVESSWAKYSNIISNIHELFQQLLTRLHIYLSKTIMPQSTRGKSFY